MSNLIRSRTATCFQQAIRTICPYCNIETATREKKDTGQNGHTDRGGPVPEGREPCVRLGGLRGGTPEGKGLPVMAARTFVGRADDMDIQILGQQDLPAATTVLIVYDEKQERQSDAARGRNGIRVPETARPCTRPRQLQGVWT